MGLLEDLKGRIQQYQATIEDDRQRIEEYNQKITEIDRIYQAMKSEKEQLVDEKRAVQTLADQTYENWTGDLYSNGYAPKVEEDIVNGSFRATIHAIDENMDALNDAKTRFENKISRTEGIIGTLEAGINSLWNEVENLMN
ncbi:YwqH-like family protein [Desemzia incerta]|uniref:YwqH-like family protein n=1 Tax=Desemzia incerta TaxID=82801 RepID=UPI003CFBEF40